MYSVIRWFQTTLNSSVLDLSSLRTVLHLSIFHCTLGKKGDIKTTSITTKPRKQYKKRAVETGEKKKAYIESRLDKHPIPERIKLVHDVIMSHVMHQKINQARLSKLVI
jgi:predicted metal-dependent HD superfamily phosphohydrolase